jgi:hypothetical protein
MRRSIIFIVPLIFLCPAPCKAQAGHDNLFSLDISYSLTSLFNHGWGIGLNYERKLFDYLSLKGNFGHMTFLTGIKDVYCTSVHLSLFANYYPLSNGLDKLYIGVGNGCDFMNYFGRGEVPPATEDTLVHITPQIGWKINILKFLMVDVSTGYKFIIINAQNYEDIKNYVNDGFRFGINVLILFKQMRKEKHDEQDG